MKITLNWNTTPENIDGALQKQKAKVDKIEAFCKENKIDELYYRDNELEYEFIKKQGAKKGGANNGKTET